MLRRPPLHLVEARKWEIKRRYERKTKVGKRTRPMAAIRIAELNRWLAYVVGAGTELEPSDWSAEIARIFVHHFVVLSDGNRRAAAWMETYCPWIEIADREAMITEANHCPLKWTADKLADKIKLTDQQRTWLKIRTIGAVDFDKGQREARRRAKRKERDAARYRAKFVHPA